MNDHLPFYFSKIIKGLFICFGISGIIWLAYLIFEFQGMRNYIGFFAGTAPSETMHEWTFIGAVAYLFFYIASLYIAPVIFLGGTIYAVSLAWWYRNR